MLVIRLSRIGKKNQPYFRIVVTEKRRPPKGGRVVEEVGSISPQTKKKVLKADRLKYWVSVGAQPSPTVYNLLVAEKIIEGKKIPVHKKSKKEVTPEAAAPTAAAPAAPETPAPAAEAPAAVNPEVNPERSTPAPEAPKAETPKEEAPEAAKEEAK